MILVAYQRTMAGAYARAALRGRTLGEAPKLLPAPAVPKPHQVLRFVPRQPSQVLTWSKPEKPKYLAVEVVPLSLPRQIISRVVAWHPGVTVEAVISKSRTRRIVKARFDAIAAVYHTCRIDGHPYSLPALGRAFGGRDHTTMLHALRARGIFPKQEKHLG